MEDHTFTLILGGPVDYRIDALFDAGCDDAMLGEIDGVSYADFDRRAESFAEAVTSAITAVESVADLYVVRVEPDDLVTMAEIAERLGRTRESIRLLVSGKRGAGDFPPPASHTRERNRLWRWTDVLRWSDPEDEGQAARARLVAALNATLELRELEPQLPERERGAIAKVRG